MPVTFTDTGHLLYFWDIADRICYQRQRTFRPALVREPLQYAGTIFLNVDSSTSDCGFRGRIGVIPLALRAAACARICVADLWRWRGRTQITGSATAAQSHAEFCGFHTRIQRRLHHSWRNLNSSWPVARALQV